MLEKNLSLVAIVKAKEDKREFVLNEILKLIPITRAEKGCLGYHLHQDNKDENNSVLYETWENYEDWQKHMKNTHMVNYADITKEATQSWQLLELTKID